MADKLENLKKFEQLHGEIKDVEEQQAMPYNFGTPTAQA